jgi:DNA polymerase-3 subunit epsilon
MPLNFIALDFETANPKRGSVIQLGIARILDGVVTKTATTFVTPPPGLQRFDYHTTKVHGIKAQDVYGAPTWPEILERIIKFSGDLPLVGHNVSVERSVIVQASEAHGIVPPEFRYFCTLKVARQVYVNEPSHSLGKLSASLGMPSFEHHDAGADAVASANLLLKMANSYGMTSLEMMPKGWLEQPTRGQARADALAAAA